MKRLAAVLVPALVIAACTSTNDSGGAAVSGVESTSTTATSVPTDAGDDAGTGAGSDTVTVETQPVTPPPTETSIGTTPATSTAPPAATADVVVVHVGSDDGGPWTPLAVWDGNAWSSAGFDGNGDTTPIPASAFESLPMSVSVASVGLAAPLTGLAYSGTDFFCVDDRQGPVLDIGTSIEQPPGATFGYTAVSVAGDWNVQPRPVDQVGLEAEVYRTVGASIVSAAGVDPTGGDVVQVIRADLDGDGVEEVLVTFQKITEGFGSAGDFSVVYARYPSADGTVVDDVLFAYYPELPVDFPTIGNGGVLAVADLNGDAVMEVVVRSEFWESALAELFVFDETLTSVADAGCGV